MDEKNYRIGEAADILQLKSYVLRFWETEFAQLAPLRTDKGQRLYTETHLALLRRIKHLLHEQGMTIDGARRIMAAEQRQVASGLKVASKVAAQPQASSVQAPTLASPHPVEPASAGDADTLRMLRDELLELRNLLLSQ